MLHDVKQTVELTGLSVFEVEGEEEGINEHKIAADFYCRINTNGVAGNVVQNVTDMELYIENRPQVRRDHSEFQEKVYDIEDKLSE